jgi:hypothetical protein
VIALILALATAAAPAAPKPPRTGPVSTLIHSESFKRPLGDKAEAFRVDYSAGLTWTLVERKACFFSRCRPVCDLTISHKTLSRQLWWIPDGKPAVLAQNSPGQREYAGGVVTLGQACARLGDHDITKAATDRLRPYQFADELIHDRPYLLKDADDYLILHPPGP